MIKYWILVGRETRETDLHTWAEHFCSPERVVARWEFPSGDVSTVFLGIDHNFFGDGPPLLFETMVFGGPEDGWTNRYPTYDEAEAGHMEACEMVRRLLAPQSQPTEQ